MTAIVKDDIVNTEALNEYNDYMDLVTSECTGKSIEELDELDDEEKNKLVSYYMNKIKGKVDFLKSSLKLSSSSEADTNK